jgi:tRNA(fMet)-specific endonuclease VapC
VNRLLDTNTCIHYLNGTSESIREHVEEAGPGNIVLCSVVKAELFYGALKSRKAKRNLKRLTRFVNRFPSLPFDDQAARVYGRIRARLAKAGMLIGPNDLMIAAIAMARGTAVVTHNTQEFSRVKNLTLEDWQ